MADIDWEYDEQRGVVVYCPECGEDLNLVTWHECKDKPSDLDLDLAMPEEYWYGDYGGDR